MTTVEYSTAKTSVWWDIENCEVPKGWDAHAIAQNMSSALLNMNYCGPVSILAYGDTNLIPHAVQQALSSTGVGLNHVPAGVKDASDKKILVDMLLWAVDNPAPANLMLISGDRDFSNALHQLSMRRYTILLAQPPRASAPLVAAARNVWLWTSLASGGPPLTSGESSGLLNNGRCNVSTPVPELTQSSNKPTGSTSVAGDTKDHKTRKNHVPRGATGVSVISSDSFKGHLSDKRHTSQAAFVASHNSHASVSTKPVHKADVVEPVLCTVCQISCANREAYANHIYGKRHRNNLELQSGKVENVSWEPVALPKEEVLARQNRRTRRRRREALIDSKKLQEKGVGEKSKPREAIKLQSQDSQENKKCFEKHVNMVNHLEEVDEKGVREKSQPIETITGPQLQSQNTQERTKCLEKQNEEFRKILLGTSEGTVKEKLTRTKDQAETVNKQLPNEEFFSSNLRCEARECYDGIVKPVNQSEGATDHAGEVKKTQKEVIERRAVRDRSKLCHLCVVICDSQGVSTLVCSNRYHWTNVKPVNQSERETVHSVEMKKKQKQVMERRAITPTSKPCHLCVVICDSQGVSTLVCSNRYHRTNQKHTKAAFVASDDAVWCQVCQISCNSKAAYANHTNGKKHRQKLELQSAKNENISKGQAKLSEENAERIKKIKDQTACDYQNHDAIVKDQTEASVDSRRSRQEVDTEKLREASLIVDSKKIREESDQGTQDDKEEVKEINAISENLVHVFNGLNRECRIPKEPRGCLDVIPERVIVPADVNVTGKFEDESKECAGRKEHPREADKKEESKVQVDNLWTRLLWGKS